jgi:hypothetical protein
VALVLAGFVAFTDGKPWGARPARTGTLWALAALTRPEAVFLLLLWCGFLVLGARSREGVRRLVAGMVPPALIYGGWLLFARAYFGALWPNTLAAKTAGAISWAGATATIARLVGVLGASDAVLGGALIAALVFGGARVWPSRLRAQRLLPWSWVLAVPVLYVLRGVPVLSRYTVPLLPVLAWLAWRSVERWWAGEEPTAGRRRRATRLGMGLAALALVQSLLLYSNAVLPQVRSFSAGLRQSLVPWGEWFHSHSRSTDAIAAPDIGALGYYSRRRVLDLAGLVTPAMVPLLERESPEDLVANFSFAKLGRPEFLVDRAPHAFDLVARSRYGPALVPLGSASVPNLGIARPDPVVYSFYRIDWAKYDSLAGEVKRGARR